MARIARAGAAGLMAIMIAVSGAAPAAADPAHLCETNPAYASMHENECDLDGHGGPGRTPGGQRGGLLGRLVGGIAHLVGL